MKNKIKTTSFWLEIIGVIMVIIETISSTFNLNLYSNTIQSLLMVVGSLLVILGVVTKKNVNDEVVYSKDDLLDDFEVNDDEK